MPLTELGYERPTYEDLLEAQRERAKLLFGEDINTDSNTPLGKYIRLNVADLADVYELLEAIYYARFPNTASGVSLDRLCTFVGISRNPATCAQHRIKFIGVAGEYVPEGFEVSTADGTLTYHIYDTLQIGADGTVEGIVECETAGTAGNVAVGKIDTIVNPDANVEEIEHIGVEVYADDIETDVSLRQRFHATINSTGSSTVAAISSAILRVPLVDGVAVIENDTNTAKDDIPPHSFNCYVLAPKTQDALIAEAIFSKKPLGIKAVGAVEMEVKDESGTAHTVAFSRTIEKQIYIKAAISTNQFFESDGVAQIKNHIADYINSLKNGEDVYLSSLYGYIYKAAGVVNVSSLTLSTNAADYITGNVEIDISEVARINTVNIEVVTA